MSLKPALTEHERMKSAVLHYVYGVEQQVIAYAYDVNIGRVNEACLAIRLAAAEPKRIRELVTEAVTERPNDDPDL